MRIFAAATTVAALAVTPMLAPVPAFAQNSDVLGQVQRFLGGNNNNNNSSGAQNAYEQGRLDQQRQEDARRQHRQPDHADNSRRYPQGQRTNDSGPGYSRGSDNGQAYGGYNNENSGNHRR